MARTTLIIGGGAAGVLLTRQLCRAGADSVILVDPSADPGAGVAYGSAAPWHLLNSPAATMSADPHEPGHFMAWSDTVGSQISAGDFAPRSLYGRYLRAVLAETVDTGRLRVIRATVTGLTADADQVTAHLDTGDRLHVTDAVLATGNPAGGEPLPDLAGHPRYIARPWTVEALRDFGDRPVLLIGTGLTAVDVALSLAVFNPATPLRAVSRHGLLPQPHRGPDEVASVQTRTPQPQASLPRLLAAVRASVRHTGDWRAVIDGMRPQVDKLWRGLTPRAQQRFVEHLARYWEVHRHRMAPQIAARLDGLIASNRLTVAADRVISTDRTADDRIGVRLAQGGYVEYGAVVNCTGPGRLPAGANPLVARLLTEGRARLGPHRLGLDVDATGRLVNADSTPHDRLWVLGALRRGRLWETTAVPEIRAQATALATAIVGALARTGSRPAAVIPD